MHNRGDCDNKEVIYASVPYNTNLKIRAYKTIIHPLIKFCSVVFNYNTTKLRI